MVEPVHYYVRVVILPQVVSVGVGVSLVMVEVDADNRNAIAIEPFDKRFEILDPCVRLYGGQHSRMAEQPDCVFFLPVFRSAVSTGLHCMARPVFCFTSAFMSSSSSGRGLS